ncbi:DUF2125 domain-containing protein [Rhodopila sp.]|uniref:DUF2125 domain-containing protein n=1 Tax=Rhodopila sp. TaxID=2480087 RepID=UPI003D0B48BD
MPAADRLALLLLLTLPAATAQAETTVAPTDALKVDLPQVLSLASLGMLTVQPASVSITRDGSTYQVRLPLSGLSAPPDAAVTAVARPLRQGGFEVSSMTFPPNGTLLTTPANGTPSRIAFTIGSQAAAARLGPTPTAETSYTAAFGTIQTHTERPDQRIDQTIDQTIDRFASNGTVVTAPDRRISFSTQNQATGLHLLGHAANGGSSDTAIQAIAGHVSIDGLDQAQGTRLLAAVRAFIASPPARPHPAAPTSRTPTSPAPNSPAPNSPLQRQQLRAVIDATPGLLNRIEADQTIQHIRFRFATPNRTSAGSVDDVRFHLAGDTVRDRLDARLAIAADGIAIPTVPAQTADLVPRHIDLKTLLTGVPTAPLIALLRAVADGQTDPALLQAQATALLAEPGARIAIEALSFDAGPLALTGSANLRPPATAGLAGTIHIAARGLDALLTRIQRQPSVQQALPIIFLAKALARPQGDSLVWDISFGDGPLTVNGTPLGQPTGK